MSADKPTPGSNEALDKGCVCPVLDNNHGRRAPFPPDGWYVAEGCPLHDPKAAQTHMPILGKHSLIREHFVECSCGWGPVMAATRDMAKAAHAQHVEESR